MPICDTCGNDYDKSFTIRQGDRTGTFDSFECAIHAMAPTCAHCDCRIIGHGVETASGIYCCANCARQAGQAGLADRAETTAGDQIDPELLPPRGDLGPGTTPGTTVPRDVLAGDVPPPSESD